MKPNIKNKAVAGFYGFIAGLVCFAFVGAYVTGERKAAPHHAKTLRDKQGQKFVITDAGGGTYHVTQIDTIKVDTTKKEGRQ